jgi:hypothetical protein
VPAVSDELIVTPAMVMFASNVSSENTLAACGTDESSHRRFGLCPMTGNFDLGPTVWYFSKFCQSGETAAVLGHCDFESALPVSIVKIKRQVIWTACRDS